MRTVEQETEVVAEDVHDYRDEEVAEDDETVVVRRVPE
jgi:hypothetical protein